MMVARLLMLANEVLHDPLLAAWKIIDEQGIRRAMA